MTHVFMYTSSMKKYFDYAVSILIVSTMFLGILYAMLWSAKLPDVHVSYTTKQCVEVINYGDTEYTCDNYPKKYNHIWVQ